jgi:hypothetical protein
MTRADPVLLDPLDARPSAVAVAVTANTTAINADTPANLRGTASADTLFMDARYLLTTDPCSKRSASPQG